MILTTSIEIIAIILSSISILIMLDVLHVLRKYHKEQEILDDAKNDIILGMARVTLLENYRLCEVKGFYSTEDREVYGKLYRSYTRFGGDEIIDEMGIKLRELPEQYESE